jgi:hypothetical protein
MTKKRPRTERRERERALDKLGRDRERLARLEPGGTPERPVVVESASQIEPHALAMSCLRCDGEERLDEHAAVTVPASGGAGEVRLRVTRLRCARCGARREVWFSIAPSLPS